MLNQAIYSVEIELSRARLIDYLPQLEIVAKLNKLRLNRSADFRLAKRLLIMSIYLN
jgi:hypothetical protein